MKYICENCKMDVVSNLKECPHCGKLFETYSVENELLNLIGRLKRFEELPEEAQRIIKRMYVLIYQL